jgi:hypothetical protein
MEGNFDFLEQEKCISSSGIGEYLIPRRGLSLELSGPKNLSR